MCQRADNFRIRSSPLLVACCSVAGSVAAAAASSSSCPRCSIPGRRSHHLKKIQVETFARSRSVQFVRFLQRQKKDDCKKISQISHDRSFVTTALISFAWCVLVQTKESRTSFLSCLGKWAKAKPDTEVQRLRRNVSRIGCEEDAVAASSLRPGNAVISLSVPYGKHESVRSRSTRLQSFQHGGCEHLGVVLAGKVETVNLKGKKFDDLTRHKIHMSCLLSVVVQFNHFNPTDLSLVSPLVEGRRGLVVLEALENGTVDHNLEDKRRS